jgi:hypothetical protein
MLLHCAAGASEGLHRLHCRMSNTSCHHHDYTWPPIALVARLACPRQLHPQTHPPPAVCRSPGPTPPPPAISRNPTCAAWQMQCIRPSLAGSRPGTLPQRAHTSACCGHRLTASRQAGAMSRGGGSSLGALSDLLHLLLHLPVGGPGAGARSARGALPAGCATAPLPPRLARAPSRAPKGSAARSPATLEPRLTSLAPTRRGPRCSPPTT